ncbi:MAG: hypothetical protein ACFCVK_10045 [Acidimicrobiales bacterium]
MLGATRLAFRVWSRETSGLLGLTPTALRIAGGALGIVACLLMYGSVHLFDDLATVTGGVASDEALLVVRSLGNGVVVSAIAIGGIFGLLTADTSAMDTLLHLAGASRAKRLAVLVVPTMAVALGITWMTTLPIVYTLSAAGGGPTVSAAIVASGVVLVSAAAVAALGLHRLVATGARRHLRLPLVHANVAALVIVLAVGAVLGWPTFAPAGVAAFPRSISPGETLHLLTVGLTRSDRGALVAGLTLLALSTVVAAVLVILSASAIRNAGDQATSITYVTVRPPRRGDLALLVWYEAVCLARSPTTLMSFFGVVGAGLGAALWSDGIKGELCLALAAAIAGAVGLHATGTNLRASWLLRSTIGVGWRVGLAKVLGPLLVVLALFAVGTSGAVMAYGPAAVVTVLVQFTLPTYFGSLLAGSLVPVDGQQPLTSAMAGALTLVISGGGLLLLTRLLGMLGEGPSQAAVPLFFVACGVAVGAVVSKVHTESVVRRA